MASRRGRYRRLNGRDELVLTRNEALAKIARDGIICGSGRRQSMNKSLWLTYAWRDNQEQDVDFLAQELRKEALDVKLDRWNLTVGQPLWDNIAKNIVDPSQCDAWAFYVTPASLGSERCIEELRYALSRALSDRGKVFPIIGIFPDHVDTDVIPSAISVRLWVSTKDRNWAKQVAMGAWGQPLGAPDLNLEPFLLREHRASHNYVRILEIRPRAGIWIEPFVGFPEEELEAVKPRIELGDAGHLPGLGMTVAFNVRTWRENGLWLRSEQGPASTSKSIFCFFRKLPNRLVFGSLKGEQYTVQYGLHKP